jgi:AcrR family transcriptional regulator
MTAEFLWRGRARPTRGPKPALSLERITDTAIGIADAYGLAAVSMQRVAAELGFTKMSLYRYLPGKAELVALMVERAIGEPPQVGTGDWRVALEEWAQRLLAAYLPHPWVLQATVGPRPIGPNELGWMECAVAAMADTGLTGAERLDAIAVLAGHARTIAEQAAATDRPEAQLVAQITKLLREHGDRFPALAATMTSAATEGPQEQAFSFGLDRILDGLQLLIAQRRKPTT